MSGSLNTMNAWAIANGFTILLHTMADSQKGAERAWAREVSYIGAGTAPNPMLDQMLDRCWQEHGPSLGLRSIAVKVSEQ